VKRSLVLCLLLSVWPARAGELAGRLTLNDKPATGITVSAVPYETSLEEARREARRGPRPEAIARAVTNAKGEWRLGFEVPPGQPGRIVLLHYAGPGVARGTMPGYWDTADSEECGETALRRGASLSGRVVDAEGHPLADAEVLHPLSADSVRTDAEGRFTLEGVSEFSSDITVRKAGYATIKAVGLRSGVVASVVLRRGLPLAGVVLAPDGRNPVAGAVVRVEGKDVAAFAETDSNGRFVVHELAAGRALVTADGGERGFRELTGVAIPQPTETVLTVALAPAPELRGRVLDVVARKPVAGALVDAVSGRRRLWTRSGLDGSFVVRPGPAGDWVLNAIALRYVQTTRRLARGQRTDKPVEMFLREGATISGRVTDDQRRPVAAASVKAAESAAGSRPTATAVTAADGTFALRRVPAVESLRVVATHPDFEPASIGDLALKPGERRTGVGFSLRRGAVLTGVVTSGDAPLPGAQVIVALSRGGFGAPPRSLAGPQWSWPRATTGADGRFRIGGLAPGDYVVTASKTGYAAESRDAVVLEGRGPEPMTFALGPEAVIAGSVRGKKGSGVADQFIRASAADASSRSSGSARTLPDGSFQIEGLKPGVNYNVARYSGVPDPHPKTVVAPADGVELIAAGTGRIAGRVVDVDGRPVPEFQVTAQADLSSSGYNWVSPARQDVSSEAGEFVLENAPAAVVEVRVLAKGYQPARVGGIAVEEGETNSGVEVRLTRGTALNGHVVEARSGKPVPDVEVSADATPGSVATDADGAFEIEGLPAGKVRVTARSPDYTESSETVEIRESGATVELKLSRGASVSAVIVSPSGEPQAGAEATLAQAGQGTYGAPKAISGPDGRAQFSHLSPGRYTLTAGSAGRRSKPVEVSVEADQERDDVRVVVGGGATVLASVTGLAPEERGHLSVSLWGAGTSVTGKELPDGRFEVRDFAPGPANISARVGGELERGGRFVNRQVTVPEDGSLDLELAFEVGFTLTVSVLRDGQPVEGVTVYANPTTRQTATNAIAATDASGSCRLTGLKAGTYRVTAFSSTTSSIAPEQKIDVSGDQAVELLLPSGRVVGRVVASGSGQPLAGAQVAIRSTNADGTFGLTRNATTDDTGRFQLAGLETGPLTLTAQRTGYVVETRTVTADSPDELLIQLARGDGLDVTGRDGLLGTPLGSFYARVFDASGSEIVSTYVRLDSAGRGEIPSLKPGSYSILAGASGLATAAFDGVPVPGPALAVTLTPGGTLDIDVPADRLKGGPLACVVTGPRGLPLAFRQSWTQRGALSLSSASSHISNFPAVSGTLSCSGFTAVPFTVTEGGTTRISVK
jgi:large repetitive protein